MLDTAPLTVQHWWLLGGGFGIVFFGLQWLLQKKILREVQGSSHDPSVPPEGGPPPLGKGRKIYYGGSVLLATVVFLAYFVLGNSWLMVGLSAAGLLVLLIGTIDENEALPPSHQLTWQLIAAGLVAVAGWTITHVSHPSGQGVLLVPGGIVLAVGWLVLLMNAINWLDGVDGLAPGVGAVALLSIAAVALLPSVQDSTTLALALIGAGGALSILLWNFPPAKIYLGTTGSWWLGLYIGAVAILGGGKIVTTLLVLAWPVADALWVITQRLAAGRPPWQGGDEVHLHHKLLARGLSPRSITALSMLATALLGFLAITLQTVDKAVGFLLVAATVAVVSVLLTRAGPRATVSE